MSKIQCSVCGKSFKAITNTHLTTHGMCVAEYKVAFPDAPIVSDEVSVRLSEQVTATHALGITGFKKGHVINEGRVPWNKNLTKADDERVAAYAIKMAGRVFTQIHRDRISESSVGKKGLCGEDNPMFGKRMTDAEKEERYDEVWFSKFTNGLLNSRKRGFRKTAPEIELEEFLKHHDPCGWVFTGDHSHWITLNAKRRKNPDFININRKQIIEVFGRYWHPDPNEEYELVEMYRLVGWDCIVVWDDDLIPNRLYQFLDLENLFDV